MKSFQANFQAEKIHTPDIQWCNSEQFSDLEARVHAYFLDAEVEESQSGVRQRHAVTADRYGGYGVGYCGGSARCGILGDVQIKGIGLTPLIGSRPGAPVDHWHSGGTVTMDEAGREAIWASICSAVLPFGAVSTLAVVLTGTQCQRTDTAPGVAVMNRRALIMRTIALRPAHFQRNVHFPTPLVEGMGVREDYLRVQQMIRSLPQAFDEAFGAEIAGASVTTRVNAGMKIMAQRFAAQVAAAFAKRLYHGSLNCTNIALDGRYVDFGTMTAVGAYRRQAGSPLWPDQWNQHSPLLRTLSYFLFHIGKHLDCPDIKSLISAAELTAEFNTTFHERSQMELLKQTGIPQAVIEIYPNAHRVRAYRCLKAIYSRGAGVSFVWRGDDDPSMVGVQPLQNLGRYDLNLILTQAAQCADSAQLGATVSALIDDASLAQEFCAVYTGLVEAFIASPGGADPVRLRAFLAANAKRLNADVSHLTREALDSAMFVFEEDPSGLGTFIDDTICGACRIMSDDPPNDLVMHWEVRCATA